MENRLKTRPPAASFAGASAPRRAGHAARGRLDLGPPVAVIDIGSNSVRLIIYEALTRSPTPIFNEKVLAGLGREVQSTGLLPADAVEKALAGTPGLAAGAGRSFYAVGGTWRALARLHMWQTGYPLHVMHGYVIPAKEALEFSRLVHRIDPQMLSRIEVVSDARRPLLAYAALVLEHLVRVARPKHVVISALGVREGLLYSLLDPQQRKRDPLIAAAQDLNVLRSRSPPHGEELTSWTDDFLASSGIDETPEEKRLRHAACLLADIGWRAHPDYRGEQSLNIVANAAFVGIDHPGRAFLALTVFFRHVGLVDEELSPRLRELASTRMLDRARILGAALRVAFLISAAMPGILPRAPMRVAHRRLVLDLDAKLAPLAGERLFNRLRQLGRLIGRDPVMVTG